MRWIIACLIYIKHILKQLTFWLFSVAAVLLWVIQRINPQIQELPNIVYLTLFGLAFLTAGFSAYYKHAPLLNFRVQEDSNPIRPCLNEEYSLPFIYVLELSIRNCGSNPELIDKIMAKNIHFSKVNKKLFLGVNVEQKRMVFSSKPVVQWGFDLYPYLKDGTSPIHNLPFGVDYKKPYTEYLSIELVISGKKRDDIIQILDTTGSICFTLEVLLSGDAIQTYRKHIKIPVKDIAVKFQKYQELDNAEDVF